MTNKIYNESSYDIKTNEPNILKNINDNQNRKRSKNKSLDDAFNKNKTTI